MTRRERTICAINHEQPDIVPYNIEFTNEQHEQTIKDYGLSSEDFADYLGNHCKKVGYNTGGRFIRDGFFQDEFGVIWDRTGIDKDIGVTVENLVVPGGSGYKFPTPDIEGILESTKRAVQNRGDTVLFGKIGMTFFERAWSLCGFQEFLTYIAIEPDFIKDLLSKVLQYNLSIIDAALECDIDGFYFGDDYGQQTGMLMSPSMWREFFKEGWATMFERVKSKGKFVALHSCGNISGILPDLIDIGLDVYQTVQPEVYNLESLKKEFGNDLAFWGAISTQRDLPNKSPTELIEIIKSTLGTLGQSGGYIAGPTHRLPPDISPENTRALIETLRNQGA